MHSQNISRKEMIMDMDIVFASNLVVEFKVKDHNNGKQSLFPQVKGIPAKISDFGLRGMLRVVFKPLVSGITFVFCLENSCNSFIHRSARYRWSVEFKLTS